MAQKDILRDRVFSLGGFRISQGSNKVSLTPSRVEVDAEMFETIGYASEKGSNTLGFSIDGALSEAEAALITQLKDDSTKVPFIIYPTSTAAALQAGATPAPVVAQGDPAIFLDCVVTEVTIGVAKNALRSFTAKLRSGGSYLYPGVVMYTNVGDAALAADFVTVPINLGALVAGKNLGCAVSVIDPPGVLGTTPTAIVTLKHDTTSGFSSPVAAATFGTFTDVPTGQLISLDGDVTPLPGEIYWALDINLSGAGAAYTFMTAIALIPKET